MFKTFMRKFYDLRVEKNFWYKTHKILTIKEKTNKFYYIKIKNICFSKDIIKKAKTQTTSYDRRRCLQEL